MFMFGLVCRRGKSSTFFENHAEELSGFVADFIRNFIYVFIGVYKHILCCIYSFVDKVVFQRCICVLAEYYAEITGRKMKMVRNICKRG